MNTRNILPKIHAALTDTPVVLLNGARQTGKSTLLRSLAEQRGAQYLTLDDPNLLLAAQRDPLGLLGGFSNDIALDEIQRAPELLLAIKKSVDENRQPGRYLLTGSANVLALPQIAESLAGRMEILNLWPFSQGEFENKKEYFIDHLFSEHLDLPLYFSQTREELIERMTRGGYPEVIQRSQPARRQAWFSSYITSILQRDIRQIAEIEGLTHIPKLLELTAARSAQLLNYAEISRSLGLPQTTLKRYLSLLQMTFLVSLLPPWSNNRTKQLTKSPKIILGDTGLLSYLLHIDHKRLQYDFQLFGHLLENFVIIEVLKQITWNKTWVKAFHWRTHAGQEIDLILQDELGRLIAIEIKSSSSITERELRHIQAFKEDVGSDFYRAIILYTGNSVVPFTKNIHAVPVSALWVTDSK